MAGVRKASGPSAAPGVVYQVQKAKARASTLDSLDGADSAGITENARELSSALHVVEESEEVRAERVRALREQIANGTYNPDPREVARKLVERGFQ
jgi:negative regulator of flagellin synthesis FlgM